MPDSIHMPSIAADDTIGPHNVFMQFTSGGRLVRNGTTVTLKSYWNAVENQAVPGVKNARTGVGTYRIFVDGFDHVGTNVPLVVLTNLVGAFDVVTPFAFTCFPLSCTDGVTVDFVCTDAGGTPRDIMDLEQQELHFLIMGRRVTQIEGVRKKVFNKANFNYGVSGL